MATHDLTLKNYQKQLKDNIKLIYDNYMDVLKTRTEHVNFDVQVKSAEIVRSYQALMQLVSEIRTFLIINDLVGDNQQNQPNDPTVSFQGVSSQQGASTNAVNSDEKLIRLRDEMSMFLYELEIPLP